MNRIIAIDPGTYDSALVLLRDDKISEKWLRPNDEILTGLNPLYWGSLRDSETGDFELTEVVIERVASYGMPVGKEVFETCFWTGRFLERLLGQYTVAPLVYLVPRSTVKKELGADRDSVVRKRMIEKFGEPGTKKSPGSTYGLKKDMWQALGLAVAFQQLRERNEISEYEVKS